jgi:hypothetical protein
VSPDDLTSFLNLARRLFAEAFNDPAIHLRIIVANGRNSTQAIEFIIPQAGSSERVVTITEDIAVHIRPQPATAAIGVTPRAEGIPVLHSIELSDTEKRAVRTVLNTPLNGKQLCRALGWPYNGSSRGIFARLKRLRVLDRTAEGFIATELGRLSVC